jgi:hypothetical protein
MAAGKGESGRARPLLLQAQGKFPSFLESFQKKKKKERKKEKKKKGGLIRLEFSFPSLEPSGFPWKNTTVGIPAMSTSFSPGTDFR